MCTKPGRATFFLWLFFSPLPRCSMNNLLMWPLFFNPKRGGHAEFQTLSSTYLESHFHPCVSSPQVGWPLHGMIHHGWRHSMATLAVWRHYIFWLIRDHVTRHGSSTHFHVSRVPFWYFFQGNCNTTHASDFAMASVFPSQLTPCFGKKYRNLFAQLHILQFPYTNILAVCAVDRFLID